MTITSDKIVEDLRAVHSTMMELGKVGVRVTLWAEDYDYLISKDLLLIETTNTGMVDGMKVKRGNRKKAPKL